jgi:hypothetical protein
LQRRWPGTWLRFALSLQGPFCLFPWLGMYFSFCLGPVCTLVYDRPPMLMKHLGLSRPIPVQKKKNQKIHWGTLRHSMCIYKKNLTEVWPFLTEQKMYILVAILTIYLLLLFLQHTIYCLWE